MMAATHSIGSILFVVLLIGAFGAAADAVRRRQLRASRLRVVGLRDLAARLSFDSFKQESDAEFTMSWGFLHRLSQGTDRYAFNILRGTYHDQSLFIFDFHYQTGSGKNTQEHDLTMLMLVFKEVFPQITITPGGENMLTKMASVFGGQDDIKFESAEFSRAFSVRSQDKRFAYDVCNPQMIEYLLANPNLQVEIQGPVILLAFEPPLAVGLIELNLQRLIEIRSRLPEYLFANK